MCIVRDSGTFPVTVTLSLSAKATSMFSSITRMSRSSPKVLFLPEPSEANDKPENRWVKPARERLLLRVGFGCWRFDGCIFAIDVDIRGRKMKTRNHLSNLVLNCTFVEVKDIFDFFDLNGHRILEGADRLQSILFDRFHGLDGECRSDMETGISSSKSSPNGFAARRVEDWLAGNSARVSDLWCQKFSWNEG